MEAMELLFAMKPLKLFRNQRMRMPLKSLKVMGCGVRTNVPILNAFESRDLDCSKRRSVL